MAIPLRELLTSSTLGLAQLCAALFSDFWIFAHPSMISRVEIIVNKWQEPVVVQFEKQERLGNVLSFSM